MTNEQRSNELMPMMKGGDRLNLLTSALLENIRIASDPANRAPVYRPARQEAVNLARRIYRDAVALAFRDQLAASLAQMQPIDHYRPDTYRSPFAALVPGSNSNE